MRFYKDGRKEGIIDPFHSIELSLVGLTQSYVICMQSHK